MRLYMRNLVAGFVAVLLCMVGFGLAYPAVVWGLSRVTTDSAEGNLVYRGECLVASTQIQDGMTDGPYFFPRAEGMSNYGASSSELEAAIAQRRADIAQREGVPAQQVPADALTGSGSGVDSGISPEYAALQAPRVAREQGMSLEELNALIEENTEHASLGFLGADAVNVTTLNLSLPTPTRCD